MPTQLEEIQAYLRQQADEAGRLAAQKFVPTASKAYGVRAPKVNALVPIYQHGGLALVQQLWQSGFLEEQILAAKIVGKIAKKYPTETLALVPVLADSIQDWAVCDTLATQGMRSLQKKYQRELFDLSRQLIHDSNLWKRRFAIVLLEGFCKQPMLREEIEAIISPALRDGAYYVQKAIEWIQRELKK